MGEEVIQILNAYGNTGTGTTLIISFAHWYKHVAMNTIQRVWSTYSPCVGHPFPRTFQQLPKNLQNNKQHHQLRTGQPQTHCLLVNWHSVLHCKAERTAPSPQTPAV